MVKFKNDGKNSWNIAKRLVSKDKKRYIQEGFDLDLSYITNQIIAMGYPSESVEGWYRNSMEDVKKFFKKNHDKKYRIYNLCSERKYNWGHFDDYSVREEYCFDDHNPPPFDMIRRFCIDCYNWLHADK